MRNTFGISRVTVTLPHLSKMALGISGAQECSGEKYQINIVAMKSGESIWGDGPAFIVGVMNGEGKTSPEHPYLRVQEVIHPTEYQLVAQHIGPDGQTVGLLPMHIDEIPQPERDWQTLPPAILASAYRCDQPDIVEATLSSVLIDTLPRISPDKAVDIALQMASAVKKAFKHLGESDAIQG